jgi:predicted nucleic-acid-binding protein
VRAVDTNVLVRLVTRDDARQVAAAEDFVAKGAWVPHLALAETTWVLSSVYDRGPEAIATAVEMLLNHQHLTVQDADTVAAAVSQFRRRPAVGFSDCLMVEVARKAGHGPLGTFDRDLGRIDGAHQL